MPAAVASHTFIFISAVWQREHYGGGGAAWPFKLLTMRAALDANKFI
jgi:hypothetical protein